MQRRLLRRRWDAIMRPVLAGLQVPGRRKHVRVCCGLVLRRNHIIVHSVPSWNERRVDGHDVQLRRVPGWDVLWNRRRILQRVRGWNVHPEGRDGRVRLLPRRFLPTRHERRLLPDLWCRDICRRRLGDVYRMLGRVVCPREQRCLHHLPGRNVVSFELKHVHPLRGRLLQRNSRGHVELGVREMRGRNWVAV